jgi:hypothetical protein
MDATTHSEKPLDGEDLCLTAAICAAPSVMAPTSTTVG